MYRYQFTSTIDDLLEAEEADTTTKTVRRSLRMAILGIGIIWIAGGFLSLKSPRYPFEPFTYFLLGIVVFYYFFGASYMRRRAIRRNNSASSKIIVEFCNEYLEIEIAEYGKFRRDWHELLKTIFATKGVLIYFNDGVVNWLPNRVFKDNAEKIALIRFLQNHQDGCRE